MLRRLILLLLIALPFKIFAQNNTLTGNIFDNDSRAIAIEGATIKNLSTKTFALSDKDGHFAIAAKVGDLISFGLAGYQTDTVYLVKLFPKNVYLRLQVNNLKTVDINTVKVSPYLDIKDPNAMPTHRVDYSKEKGGLRLNIGYGKYRKEQLKIQQLEENDKIQTEISKYFNEETVKSTLKFEGPDIKDFISMYRPTADQIKAETPFNYTYYTVKAYHTWLKLPADQRKLPSLPKLKVN